MFEGIPLFENVISEVCLEYEEFATVGQCLFMKVIKFVSLFSLGLHHQSMIWFNFMKYICFLGDCLANVQQSMIEVILICTKDCSASQRKEAAKNYQLECEIVLMNSLASTSWYEECCMTPYGLYALTLICMKDCSAGPVPCQETETCMRRTAKNHQLEYVILFGKVDCIPELESIDMKCNGLKHDLKVKCYGLKHDLKVNHVSEEMLFLQWAVSNVCTHIEGLSSSQ